MNRPFALLAAIAALAFINPAQAAFVYTFTQVGSDVHLSGTGAIDFIDLGHFSSAFSHGVYTDPSHGIIASGPDGGWIFVYEGVSGPASFGPGSSNILATHTTGDFLYIGAVGHSIAFSSDYLLGNLMTNSAIYEGQSFASMGLTPGSYVYTWGSGEHADSLTVAVLVGDPIPEPGSVALAGIGLAGLLFCRWRNLRAGRRPAH